MDTLSILRVPLDALHLDPANARQHGDRNLEAIRASLASFGQVEPLVVHKPTQRVIGGNDRLQAMRALGWTHADVVELDIPETQATALGIALNRTAELAEWDLPSLGALLQSLPDLEGVGFNPDDLQELLDSLQVAHPVNEDEVPEPPDAATSKPADLWVLGRHRLLCGDSSIAAHIDRLVAGEPIHLLHTDAPYNVCVEPRSNNAIAAGNSSFHHQKLDLARHPEKAKATHDKLRPKDRPLANDFVSEEEFDRLLRAWYGNAARVLLPGRAFYCYGGHANLAHYPAALKEFARS